MVVALKILFCFWYVHHFFKKKIGGFHFIAITDSMSGVKMTKKKQRNI